MTQTPDLNIKKSPKLKYDGSITIAEGRSRHATNWKNRELLWSELVEKLSQTTRTRETFAEYQKMAKAQKDQVKDVGGFVGGALKNGRRKTDHISWRSLLTLDADFAKGDLWAAVESMLGCACVVYSTHSHSPSSPRLRLVIPLARPITPDEYPAVARRVAADLGIDFFDDTTYQPHRLMYWPSTAADGEYVFKFLDAPWLDPDEVLARYPDWRDPSYWPESSRAQNARKKLAEKQGDPMGKAGLVGAFCRTYTVPEAIEAFLSDIYAPAGPDRYTYVPGTSTGGLVIYDDGKFAYSHHGTDPISGLLVNAFDLVRLHKFGELDEGAAPDIDTTKLPSYTAMVEFCQNDEATKRTLGEERLEKAAEDFTTATTNEDWMVKLEYTKAGEIKATLPNLVLILRHDPNLQGIAYDAHRGAIVLLKPVPWRKPTDWRGPDWSDDDDDSLQVYLSNVYDVYSPAKVKTALVAASHERAFHPIRDYLNSLEWDGIPRVERLLIDYLNADDTPYVRAVTRKTLTAAVARVMRPGCKFDYMLVLVGPQGIGKSTLFERLGGKWFNDSLSLNDTKDKTAAEKLQGYWIMEIGELAGIRKAEVEAVKSFLSRQRDIYRPAYGRRTVEHPRQCIVAGSTNADAGFLRDSTGNRRFWPVNVLGPQEKAPWDLDRFTIDQIWAEAVEIWKAGEPLYLEGAAAAEAIEQQKAAMETDERLGLIREYLDRLLPADWETRTIAERQAYFQGGDFGQEAEGTVRRDRVCVAEIWCECFGRDLATIKRFDMDEIHGLLRQIEGWERYAGTQSGKLWFGPYGSQRAYVRIADIADDIADV